MRTVGWKSGGCGMGRRSGVVAASVAICLGGERKECGTDSVVKIRVPR